MNLVNITITSKTPLPQASCGLFGFSEDYGGPYLSLDERFVKNRSATFFFEARGDSMMPLINEKDVLIVDKTEALANGRVVVTSINGEFVCKRYFKYGSKILLRSDNSKHSTIEVGSDIEFEIFGVVIGLARDVKR